MKDSKRNGNVVVRKTFEKEYKCSERAERVSSSTPVLWKIVRSFALSWTYVFVIYLLQVRESPLICLIFESVFNCSRLYMSHFKLPNCWVDLHTVVMFEWVFPACTTADRVLKLRSLVGESFVAVLFWIRLPNNYERVLCIVPPLIGLFICLLSKSLILRACESCFDETM